MEIYYSCNNWTSKFDLLLSIKCIEKEKKYTSRKELVKHLNFLLPITHSRSHDYGYNKEYFKPTLLLFTAIDHVRSTIINNTRIIDGQYNISFGREYSFFSFLITLNN